MSEIAVQFGMIYILVTAFLAARPWLSRRNVLFGVVFGSGKIRRNPDARCIVRRFVAANILLAAAIAAAMYALMFTLPVSSDGSGRMFAASIFILLLAGALPYVLAHRAVKNIKKTLTDPNLVRDRITVELGSGQEKRPVRAAWFLLLLAPVIVTAWMAAYYFDLNGSSDAGAYESAGSIMTPVTGQIILAAIFLLAGLVTRNASPSVKGSPGAAPKYYAFRRFLSWWIIVFGMVMETGFMLAELTYAGFALDIRVLTIGMLTAAIAHTAILVAAFFRMARRQEPSGSVYDDDGKWVLGMFYFNPADPSIFVEKRSGIGQTINFGRPAAWIVIAGIAALILASLLLGR